ncbi:polysaccharide deacetylase family protein [Mesorhizobium sp. NPDC059025]|uniref:polysaccharide deacetylase family protein n=1 Tax=unclassified Mesorhizobium TaxID=325217 RepID=UPI0036AFF030
MPIPILAYHQVDVVVDCGSPIRSLTVKPADFLRQMTWLKRAGWGGLSIRDLLPYLKGDMSGRVFGITFDDGFRNVHTHALPILETLGFTATTYLVSRQIGGFNKWDAAIGVPYSACMSKQEILEWNSLGHEVGSHTLDHPRLGAIGRAEAWRQIAESRSDLEDMLGSAVSSFSYPYGDVSTAIRDMVAEAGYSSATTAFRGRARSRDDILLLPRRAVHGADGWVNVLRKSLTG